MTTEHIVGAALVVVTAFAWRLWKKLQEVQELRVEEQKERVTDTRDLVDRYHEDATKLREIVDIATGS